MQLDLHETWGRGSKWSFAVLLMLEKYPFDGYVVIRRGDFRRIPERERRMDNLSLQLQWIIPQMSGCIDMPVHS